MSLIKLFTYIKIYYYNKIKIFNLFLSVKKSVYIEYLRLWFMYNYFYLIVVQDKINKIYILLNSYKIK